MLQIYSNNNIRKKGCLNNNFKNDIELPWKL